MKITHEHPTYTREEERLERLRDIKRACLAKLATSRAATKRA